MHNSAIFFFPFKFLLLICLKIHVLVGDLKANCAFMIHVYNCFAYNKWVRGDLKSGSLHEKNQVMSLSHKAVGFMSITVSYKFIYQFVSKG